MIRHETSFQTKLSNFSLSVFTVVNLAAEKLSVPITCKIRVFEDIDKTVEYAKMLEKAGCQVIIITEYSTCFAALIV